MDLERSLCSFVYSKAYRNKFDLIIKVATKAEEVE